MDLYKEHNIIPKIAYSVDSSQSDVKQESAILSGNYPDILNGDLSRYKEWIQDGVIADITQAYEDFAQTWYSIGGSEVLEAIRDWKEEQG